MESAFGKELKRIRKSLKLTAEDLAKRVGINRTYISKIEKQGLLPSENILEEIIKKLNLSKIDNLALSTAFIYEKVKDLKEELQAPILQTGSTITLKLGKSKPLSPSEIKELKGNFTSMEDMEKKVRGMMGK